MKILFSFLLLAVGTSVLAQDFSNKGKDFWLGYPTHSAMYTLATGAAVSTGGGQDMVLYLTSDRNATVTVEAPGIGYSKTYTVTANQITETAAIPKSTATGGDLRLTAEGQFYYGIHITSDQPIVAYAHVYSMSVSGASLLFPTPTLGQDYYVLGYKQTSNSAWSYPFAFVVATEDSTTVAIIPSVPTAGGHAAGDSFTVKLKKGEIYNIFGKLITNVTGSTQSSTAYDLTGTHIHTVNTGSGCKKIAVFCGTGKIDIQCNGTGTADNTVQQIFPSSAWGKKYLAVPTSKLPFNYYRVMVQNPSTVVKVNGVVQATLNSGRYYEFSTSSASVIEADQPVMVAQFITSANQCTNTSIGSNGDPEMIYLSPVEQTINQITLNSTSHYLILSQYHFINVMMKTSGVSGFTLDGVNRSSSFSALPYDATYSYAQINVAAGYHNLYADSGFNAIAYGYGNAESYGYNAGTNVLDLNQHISITNKYATVNVPTTCRNTPFRFAITLPYQANTLTWKFNSNPILSPNADTAIAAPVYDSTYISSSGKTLYVYKLKKDYVFKDTGSCPVVVLADNPTADGCSGIQEIDYTVIVYEKPVAQFTFANNGCITDSVRFTNTSNTSGRSITQHIWDFGDTTATSPDGNPVHLYTNPTTHNVHYTLLTDAGCIADTTIPVTLTAIPTAAFTVLDTTCVSHPVYFKDQSTLSAGTITAWLWDYGNGKTDSLLQSSTTSSTYDSAGVKTTTLTVRTNSGCTSAPLAVNFTVGSYPVLNYLAPDICTQDAYAQFRDSTTLADSASAAGPFSYLWNFGDPNANAAHPNTSTAQNPQHIYSSLGNYTVSERVVSPFKCVATESKTFTVNGDSPKADFLVTSTGNLCSNLPVSIKNNSSVNFGIVTRIIVYWDYVNNPTQADTVIRPATGLSLKHLYPNFQGTTTKSFRIHMAAFSGSSVTSCAASKDTVITINPSPKVAFTALPGICVNVLAKQITQASETGGVTGTFAYYGTGVNTTGTFTPSVTGVGDFAIKYVFTSNKGCADSATQNQRVWALPIVAFGFSYPECVTKDIGFTDSSITVTGAIIKRQWDFGDGSTKDTASGSLIKRYATTGTFNVSLKVLTDSGCVSNALTKSIVIHPLPIVAFTMPEVCLPAGDAIFTNTSTISDGSQALFTYVWNFHDPNNNAGSALANGTHHFSATGPYNISLAVTSKDGCTDSLTQSWTTIYPQPKAVFGVSASEICMGATINFTDSSKGNGATVGKWNWSFADGTSSTVQNPMHMFKDSGSYAVSLFIYNGHNCVSDTAVKTIVSDPYPHVDAGKDTVVLEGGTIRLNPVYYALTPQFLWTPSTYLTSDTAARPYTTPADDITYKLTITGQGGCSASDTMHIVILKTPQVPNAFSPNGDGVNDTWHIPYLQTYPGCTVDIFNRYGQQVFHSVGYPEEWTGRYDGKPLDVGTYYYVIDPKNGRKVMAGYVTILR